LIKTNITLSDFNGQESEAQGILNMDLTVGGKTIPTSFFIVSSKSTCTVLLRRDWIHANCFIPSMMHQCLIQWDGDVVEVVHVDDSIDISHAAMSVWDAEDQEPISRISLEGCDHVEATKSSDTGLIHRPHRVDEVLKIKHSDALGKADPCSRPQKIKCGILMTDVSHSGNNHKGPTLVAGHTLVGMFQALMSMISHTLGISHSQHLSAKVDPSLREPMIALLKEYSNCFAWDYMEMPGLDRSIIKHRLPLKKGFRLFQQ
jgi:hypothetical protein